VGNEQAVMTSICDIYRPASLFLTNKENFVASNGDFHGTQINSSNMLWSLSGNLSIVYKVLFGMRFEPDRLAFHPFVPKALGGKRTLTNVRYRDAVLDISMEGYGNRIRAFAVDGKEWAQSFLPATLTGEHKIDIILADNILPDGSVFAVGDYTSPAAPVTYLSGNMLLWPAVEGAVKYNVYKNGIFVGASSSVRTDSTVRTMVELDTYGLYQVEAMDARGVSSFLSEPIAVFPPEAQTVYQVETFAGNDLAAQSCQGYTGEGFTEISGEKNRLVTLSIVVKQPGRYAIDFRYSNGNGPVNTENKCAIRNLHVDGQFAGALVFPQRGKGDWSSWGYSNALTLNLASGNHKVVVSFEGNDENMNGDVNRALLDCLRLTRVGGE
jgi:hypothetical protein